VLILRLVARKGMEKTVKTDALFEKTAHLTKKAVLLLR